MSSLDQILIRRTIQIAWSARRKGNHPFGALLSGPQGKVLIEAENSVITRQDVTGHAELNLVRDASHRFPTEYLASCILYSSTEPCPMCAGAIFWSNIRRVVFGLSESGLSDLVGPENTEEVLLLSCRNIFLRGQKEIEVIGPLLEEEARQVHLGFWD
jgi:tRNA(Arg) A34 adenosine deaminase TadA